MYFTQAPIAISHVSQAKRNGYGIDDIMSEGEVKSIASPKFNVGVMLIFRVLFLHFCLIQHRLAKIHADNSCAGVKTPA